MISLGTFTNLLHYTVNDYLKDPKNILLFVRDMYNRLNFKEVQESNNILLFLDFGFNL